MITVTLKWFNSEDIVGTLEINRPFMGETIFHAGQNYLVIDIVHAGRDLIAYVQETVIKQK